MTDIVKEIANHIYSDAVSLEVDWKNSKNNPIYIIGHRNGCRIYYIISIVNELDVFLHIICVDPNKPYDRKEAGYDYGLATFEDKLEFQNAINQLCIDIYNSGLKLQKLIDFI